MRRRARAIAWSGFAAIACLACSATGRAPSNEVEAPSFNHISESELQSAMWQLASGVARLDRILAPERVMTADDRLDVIRILRRMEDAMESLGPTGWPSNHPRITRHAGDFRAQLTRARQAVEREPPAYALVGTVSAACLTCHGGE